MNSFHYAETLANLLYGLEMESEDFEEIGLVAYRLIGNKRTKLYRYCAQIDCDDLSLKLPCNADILEAVTTAGEGQIYDTLENYKKYANVENEIKAGKIKAHPLYISGTYVKYERVGDVLYFDKNYGAIQVLYKGEMLDDEGLPEITNKEAEAIATYCAYADKFKDGIATNNANSLQIAEVLKQQWLIKCDQARVPENLSQNELDQVLDAKTSWNRKVYNRSFKPIV